MSDELQEYDPSKAIKDRRRKRLKELALSGVISGAVLGAGGKAISGASKIREIVKAGLAGGAAGGALSAGSGAAGGIALGEPDDAEESAHTKRGALGGLLAGGLAGGLIGGAATSAKVRGLVMKLATKGKQEQKLSSMFKSTDADGKVNNILLERMKKIADPKIGAAVGAGTLGSVAAYQGADEGMQLDLLASLRREKKRKEMEERYAR